MRLLDAFCGEGGASAGYAAAGFEVVGVDTSEARLARYPHESHQADAVEFILAHGHEFDAIHASPPCQGYSRATVAVTDRLARYDRLIAATRAALQTHDVPYVIENVYDARGELRNPALLCGRQFGLEAEDTDETSLVMDRHRLFETNWMLMVPPHPPHDTTLQVAGAYGGARRDKNEARHIRKGGYVPKSLHVIQTLLGTPWMSEEGCFLSIPPVYAEFIGGQLADLLMSTNSLASRT
jgi:DNA (cytosine-5)-methyltransferase 1